MKNYILLLLGIAFLINDTSAQKNNKNLEKKETVNFIKMPEDRILKNGFWLDLGFGLTNVYEERPLWISYYGTSPANWEATYSVDFRFGNKWYYPKGKLYQFGFQVIWFGGGVAWGQTAYLDIGSLGFCSLLRLNEKTGIEINLNVGPTFSMTDVGYIGGQVNLECKYRVGYFSIGTRIRYFRGWYRYREDMSVVNVMLLVGAKF